MASVVWPNIVFQLENPHLLNKGKYYCTVDFQFDCLGFSSFPYVKIKDIGTL